MVCLGTDRDLLGLEGRQGAQASVLSLQHIPTGHALLFALHTM